MSFANWMSFLKDEVKLKNVVMPGSHNSGSRGMMPLASCQDGSLAEQFSFGVRQFCLRLDTNKLTKKIVFCHSVIQGKPLEDDLRELRKIMDENPSEFIILDISEYYTETFGPFKFKFRADPKEVDRLLEKHLAPSEYALTDFDSIGDVTMGDIRRAGKRFLLISRSEEYKFSVNCAYENPWTPERHCRKAPTFAERATEVYDQIETDGIFVLQTQQTVGLGTEVGLSYPRKLDKGLRQYFDVIIDKIKANPKYLEKANVISGDYMTEDYFKVKKIIALNILKGNINETMLDEFEQLVK